MPLIQQQHLKTYLEKIRGGASHPVYLIFGEPFLCDRALSALLRELLSDTDGFGYEPFDGAVADVREVIEKLSTFSLFSEKRVVVLLDAKGFSAKTDADGILKKSKEKYDIGDLRSAARYFLSWMAASNMDFENIVEMLEEKAVKGDSALYGSRAWIEHLARYCKENDLSLPDAKGDLRILEDAVRKGFPEKNVLVITAGRVDRRTSLYQIVADHGMAVDCTVPAGNSLAERKARDAVLKDCIQEILKPENKSLDPQAHAALCDMTGFELRVLKGNLEKLIAFTGARPRITLKDVEAVLSRTKTDPVFELTGAVMEKDLEKAFFFLNSLMQSDMHPMAVLSALANQVRKLIAAKEFLKTEGAGAWDRRYTFKRFQEKTLPRLEAYLKQIEKAVGTWPAGPPENGSPEKKKKKGAEKPVTDLLAVRGGAGAYPMFKLMGACEHFQKEALISALVTLCEIDRRLKSTPVSPRLLLEKALVSICRPEETALMLGERR